MPPLVYQKLVQAGALAVSDLERFARGGGCSDARRALVLLIEEDAVRAAEATQALHRVRRREGSASVRELS